MPCSGAGVSCDQVGLFCPSCGRRLLTKWVASRWREPLSCLGWAGDSGCLWADSSSRCPGQTPTLPRTGLGVVFTHHPLVGPEPTWFMFTRVEVTTVLLLGLQHREQTEACPPTAAGSQTRPGRAPLCHSPAMGRRGCHLFSLGLRFLIRKVGIILFPLRGIAEGRA